MTHPFPQSPPHPSLVEAPIGYRDPFTGGTIDAAGAQAILDLWARVDAANRGIRVACGIAWWKRRRIAQFLWAADRPPIRFTDQVREALRLSAGGPDRSDPRHGWAHY